jgi:hypothetical protein
MDLPAPAHILVIAHRTAATPTLIEHIRERAGEGPARFTLLVPNLHAASAPETGHEILELAIPLMEEAAGGPVEGHVGDPDPYVAVLGALREEDYDEFVVSTLPKGVSRWLQRDLPTQLCAFGRPVAVVTAPGAARPATGPPRR